MNDYTNLDSGPRNQTLIVVEGKREKDYILRILLKSFKEIPIQMENIHVYESNIYDLYREIENEYGAQWYEDDLDINIPLLISRRNHLNPVIDKKDFTNIILMFDYERQDTFFSSIKILKMQKHFRNVEDEGILYINYPMIESMYHYKNFPDKDFISRNVSVKCRPGSMYKQIVRDESVVFEYLNLYENLRKCISSKVNISKNIEEEVIDNVLSVTNTDALKDIIDIFTRSLNCSEKKKTNLKYSLFKLVSKQAFINDEISYWNDIRNYLIHIALDNIRKANWLVNKQEFSRSTIKEQYYSIDWSEVLEVQNKYSADDKDGIIMVLCTFITILGEYKFFWNVI